MRNLAAGGNGAAHKLTGCAATLLLGLPGYLIALCLSGLPLAALASTDASESAAAARPPNVILILLDDAGWRDTGFSGNRYIETPNLDALAARSMRFSTAYATHPFCSPTRQSLISGQWPARTAWARHAEIADPDAPRGAPPYAAAGAAAWTNSRPEFTSLPEALVAAGYVTAHIGKWHFGNTGGATTPASEGFHHSFGGAQRVGAVESFFAPYAGLPEDVTAPPGEYLTDRLTEEAIAFIRQQRHKPFYLQLSHYAPHTPIQAPEHVVDKYRKKKQKLGDPALNPTYAAMIDVVDRGVARILRHLEALEIADNTVILVTSDNGGVELYGSIPVTSMAPLRGEKNLIYEGGVRVPLLVYWPGVTTGTDFPAPVNLIDFYPTILELASVPAPAEQTVDGVSLVPVLRGEPMPGLGERPHFWYNVTSGLTAKGEVFQPIAAVRRGKWRLLKPFQRPLELYDFSTDPAESRNVATANPAVTAELETLLDAWLADTGVVVPTVNPFYDPAYTLPLQVPELSDRAVLAQAWQQATRASRWRELHNVKTAMAGDVLRVRADGIYPEIGAPGLKKHPQGHYAIQIELRVATAGRVRFAWGETERDVIELLPERDGRWHTLTGVFQAQEPLRFLRLAAPTHLHVGGQYDAASQPDWIELRAVRLYAVPPAGP